nr:selenium-dependent molybdenum cofactor biosynthesis protein YqeB [Sedimentibacter sp.]
MKGNVVLVRGGGDIASGVVQKLHRSGFRVLILETKQPTSIRREVCFSEAVYNKKMVLEDTVCILAENADEIYNAWEKDQIPIAVDPEGHYIKELKPDVVVDSIIAKKNTGMRMERATITVAVGPGFCAGKDVDAVIESNRGHNLGRIIFEGEADPNTKTPGNIDGFTWERVIYSPCKGTFRTTHNIGDIIKCGETVATVDGKEVKAKIDGILRGILRDNTHVTENFKVGDVDPRVDQLENCFSISDKARAIGGGVLEAVMILKRIKGI